MTFHLAGEKLALLSEGALREIEGVEVVVNFCTPHILSAVDTLFQEVHDVAGDELAEACQNYKGMGVGSCCLTDAFKAKNFKKIAHCIIPPSNKYELADQFDYSLCLRNVLDYVAESGHRSILFRHPYLLFDRLVARITLLSIGRWLAESPYAGEMEKIVIVCGSPDLHQLYQDTATELERCGADLDRFFPELNPLLTNIDGRMVETGGEQVVDLRLVEEMLQAEFEATSAMEAAEGIYASGYDLSYGQDNGSAGDPYEDEYDESLDASAGGPHHGLEQYGFDEQYVRENAPLIYDDMFKTPEGLQLQLSRNLSPTILTIEEEDGTLRQYRMTTQNREGDTSYFRCSRCESLMRHTNSEYRPKITVKGGFIFGDCFPTHHPECHPLSKYHVILQQMDRQARLNLAKAGPGGPLPPGGEWGPMGACDEGMMEAGGEVPIHEGLPLVQMTLAAQRDGGRGGARAALNSAKSRLQMVDAGSADSSSRSHQMPTVISSELTKHIVSGNTLQAIRKCESELNREEGTFDESQIGEQMEMGGGIAGLEEEGDEMGQAIPINVPLNPQQQSALWLQQRAESQRRHKREARIAAATAAGLQPEHEEASNDGMNEPPHDSTKRTTRSSAAAAKYHEDMKPATGAGGGAGQQGHSRFTQRLPPGASSSIYGQRRVLAPGLVYTGGGGEHHASSLVYKIPYPDTSSLDAYGDDTSMAEHSPAAGPDDLHSPGISGGGLAGEGATAGKHKKYRIIRQRNKATTTFDWTTTTTKTTSTTATAMAKSKGAGGKK